MSVLAGFFVAGNALNAAYGVFIENVVVADPQFEREAGAQGDEALERGVVANRPRQTAQDDQRERSGWDTPGEFSGVVRMDGGPKQEERECDSERWVGKKSEGPENGVGQPEFFVRRFCDEESHPDERCSQKDRERGVPDPFERHDDASREEDPKPRGGDGDVAAGDAAGDFVKRKGDG